MSRIRTLLIGANDALLDGIVDWVANDAQLEVVGRAHCGAVAVDRIAALRAELVLVDVSLPDMSGFDVARRIKARADAPLVVLLSFYDSQAARLEGWAAGADGFVAQSEITEQLTSLVAELLRNGEPAFEPRGSAVSSKRVPPPDVSE